MRRKGKEKEKEKEKEKKKENVGIFSVNSSFFLDRKKRKHREDLPFYLIRCGPSRDSSSPNETKKSNLEVGILAISAKFPLRQISKLARASNRGAIKSSMRRR